MLIGDFIYKDDRVRIPHRDAGDAKGLSLNRECFANYLLFINGHWDPVPFQDGLPHVYSHF